MAETPWDPVDAAATAIIVDRAAAEVVSALRAADVRSILLKGASFDRWLYESSTPRMYGDVDLLVAEGARSAAEGVLAGLGYEQQIEDFQPTHVDHAILWYRPSDGSHLDLHTNLTGAAVPRERSWQVLSDETEPMAIGGAQIDVLSEAGRAMHIALHAAAHGHGMEKPLMDLDRALERAVEPTWQTAARIARELGAEEAFAAGLCLDPRGEELAARLGLTGTRSVDTTMRTQSVPYSSFFVNRVAETPGLWPKARLLARRFFPEPSFMRSWYPLARRGRLGLALTYGYRQLWLLVTGPRAVFAWWRAKRAARPG